MIEPISQSRNQEAIDQLKDQYLSKKDEFLALCGRYDLTPRSLTLLAVGKRVTGPMDRTRLIRLVITLTDLEKLLGPRRIEELLFAMDESDYLNSGIFAPSIH